MRVKIHSDTPKKLIKLYHQCIEFEREKRPLFPYIVRRICAIPKIRRSSSAVSSTTLHITWYLCWKSWWCSRFYYIWCVGLWWI